MKSYFAGLAQIFLAILPEADEYPNQEVPLTALSARDGEGGGYKKEPHRAGAEFVMVPQQSADILLVEDDASDAELALAALRERNISHRVVHVMDGHEALDFIFYTGMLVSWGDVNAPKVILLDLQLKTVNGLDVLRQLKSEERTKTIPVVVFTGSRKEIELVESYRLGVNSYVIKPTDHKMFAQVVGDIGHYWLNVNQPMAL